MRITSEVLQRLADDFIQKRLRTERDILAVYLHGTVLTDEPAMGGAADIDLFFIHVNPVPVRHEIERITDDIHLDIAHHERGEYNRTRQLRVHPWMGPVVNSYRILYDPQHFLNFTQAGVRAQFDRPENVLARARQRQSQARQIWLNYQLQLPEPGPERFSGYLDAVVSAAQAVALLSGLPMTERRLLVQFGERAQAVDQPDMQAGLIGLLGGANFNAEKLGSWLPEWKNAFAGLPAEKAPVRLRAQRFNYFWRAFETFKDDEHAKLALWPLLRTWTDLVLSSKDVEGVGRETLAAWQEVTAQLELTGDAFEARLAALDAFLDRVEETLEAWGQVRGI